MVYINRLLSPVFDLSLLISVDHGSVECGRPVSRCLISVCTLADDLTLKSQWEQAIVAMDPFRSNILMVREFSHLLIIASLAGG